MLELSTTRQIHAPTPHEDGLNPKWGAFTSWGQANIQECLSLIHPALYSTRAMLFLIISISSSSSTSQSAGTRIVFLFTT